MKPGHVQRLLAVIGPVLEAFTLLPVGVSTPFCGYVNSAARYRVSLSRRLNGEAHPSKIPRFSSLAWPTRATKVPELEVPSLCQPDLSPKFKGWAGSLQTVEMLPCSIVGSLPLLLRVPCKLGAYYTGHGVSRLSTTSTFYLADTAQV